KNILCMFLSALTMLCFISCTEADLSTSRMEDILKPSNNIPDEIVSETEKIAPATQYIDGVTYNAHLGEKTKEGIVYTNNKCNYSITFPLDWEGWYAINEFDEGSVEVKFWGKSKTGSTLNFDYSHGGLSWFFILTEQALNEGTYDSIKLIGTINESNYYYATGTSTYIGALNLNSLDALEYDFDEHEMELIAKDWDKVNQMELQVNGILTTFAPLPDNATKGKTES
ncbi:MAG: hypothetical protein M0R40_10890, partial [Firmicutes bacterium]|nr:hypothetical protein [Bacillota bacterium]